MGGCNTAYVPAAILYENPGVNREEFVALLDKIRFGGVISHTREWNDCGTLEEERDFFHRGIFGLVEILYLKSKVSVCFDDPVRCPDLYARIGVEYWPHQLHGIARRGKNRWLKPSYEIWTHIAEELGEPKLIESSFFNIPEVGQLYGQWPFREKVLTKVIHIGPNKPENGYDKRRCKVEMCDLTPKFESVQYQSLAELVQAHPEMDPDACIDWSKAHGMLGSNMKGKGHWYRQGDGYYLDVDRFKEHDYTSMIITSEAIRQKAWNLLGYYGYMQTNRFLVDHPDSFARHAKEVANYWLHEHARKNNLSISELLRMRLLSGAAEPMPPLDDRTALHIVCKEGDRYHGLYEEMKSLRRINHSISCNAEFYEAQKEPELPF